MHFNYLNSFLEKTFKIYCVIYYLQHRQFVFRFVWKPWTYCYKLIVFVFIAYRLHITSNSVGWYRCGKIKQNLWLCYDDYIKRSKDPSVLGLFTKLWQNSKYKVISFLLHSLVTIFYYRRISYTDNIYIFSSITDEHNIYTGTLWLCIHYVQTHIAI